MVLSQAQAATRRKLLAAMRMAKPARARNGRPLPRAWFMTDPKRTPHPEAIAARLQRGFGVIFRHFGAADRYEVGARLARICRRRRLVLLVSADPDLARAIHADGVHWPEARLAGARGRNVSWIETASAHSARAAARAVHLGIDAVIVSTIFRSASPTAGRPTGAWALRALARRSPRPIYGLGGINADNAARLSTHAAGWAAIDAVMSGWG
jgi:thiamine-phosphate pyrophosphorylase